MSKFMKISLALLFLPVIVLGAQMGYYASQSSFNKVEVVVHGFDPRNLFSGFYMELLPDWNATDCKQFADKQCPIKEFEQIYNFYINKEHSNILERMVEKGKAALVFSYKKGRKPMVVDLKIEGVPYKEFIAAQKEK